MVLYVIDPPIQGGFSNFPEMHGGFNKLTGMLFLITLFITSMTLLLLAAYFRQDKGRPEDKRRPEVSIISVLVGLMLLVYLSFSLFGGFTVETCVQEVLNTTELPGSNIHYNNTLTCYSDEIQDTSLGVLLFALSFLLVIIVILKMLASYFEKLNGREIE